MAKNHFILDFETMGTDTQTCAVLDCAYMIFDWDRFTSDNPYTFKELTHTSVSAKLDIKSQVKQLGYKVDQDTVKFWGDQTEKVRQKILPSDKDITVSEFILNLLDYISIAGGAKYWWSRANSFDPPILWRLAKDVDNIKPIHNRLPHWTLRDTRTFIDAKTNFSIANGFCPVEDKSKWDSVFEQHNSTHDIAADILRLQTLSRIEKDLSVSEIS